MTPSDRPILFILSAPRSFTSLVSSMLGQHPDAYAFPELDLFVGETLDDVLRYHRRMPPLATDGLMRAVAELEFGEQSHAAVAAAREWVEQRRAEPAVGILDYLLSKIPGRLAIEKSPITGFKANFLLRAAAHYPNARYIHLLRSPLAAIPSIRQVFCDHTPMGIPAALDESRATMLWCQIHANIQDFTATLAPERWRRVQGEQLLADPRRHLGSLAEWLGLRTDEEALEAMLRPDLSPYASVGPDNAPWGNDPKFLREPHFRQPAPRESEAIDPQIIQRLSAHAIEFGGLVRSFGY